MNGAALKPERGDFRAAGDASIGYNQGVWGVIGRGAFGYYNFYSPQLWQQNSHGEASADVWYAWKLDPVWWLESRGSLGWKLYVNQLEPLDRVVEDAYWIEERSTMGRGQLLGGIRYQPDLAFAAGLWLGGGVQLERFVPDTRSETRLLGGSDSQTRWVTNARLRIQYGVLPDLLAVRLRGDAAYFGLSREVFLYDYNTVSSEQTLTRTDAMQFECSGRLFLDIEMLAVADFVPALHVGLDYVYVEATGSMAYSSTVPSVGVGIRREVF